MPKIAIVQKPCYIEATCRRPYEALVTGHQCMFTTKQKQIFPFHKAGENVLVLCFPLFSYTWKVELFSKYVFVSAVVPCVICLIYTPPNVQAVGEILLDHLNISRKMCWKCPTIGQCRKYANFVRLCPNGSTHEASGSLTFILWGPWLLLV